MYPVEPHNQQMSIGILHSDKKRLLECNIGNRTATNNRSVLHTDWWG